MTACVFQRREGNSHRDVLSAFDLVAAVWTVKVDPARVLSGLGVLCVLRSRMRGSFTIHSTATVCLQAVPLDTNDLGLCVALSVGELPRER